MGGTIRRRPLYHPIFRTNSYITRYVQALFVVFQDLMQQLDLQSLWIRTLQSKLRKFELGFLVC